MFIYKTMSWTDERSNINFLRLSKSINSHDFVLLKMYVLFIVPRPTGQTSKTNCTRLLCEQRVSSSMQRKYQEL